MKSSYLIFKKNLYQTTVHGRTCKIRQIINWISHFTLLKWYTLTSVWLQFICLFWFLSLRGKCQKYTEFFLVNLRIQSEYRKIRTRNNSVFGHFTRRVCVDFSLPLTFFCLCFLKLRQFVEYFIDRSVLDLILLAFFYVVTYLKLVPLSTYQERKVKENIPKFFLNCKYYLH